MTAQFIQVTFDVTIGIHFFLARVGIRHTATVNEIWRAKSQIQELAMAQQFGATLYYLLPENWFQLFVTIPEKSR